MSRVARERLTSGSAVTRRHFVITTALASGGLLLHGAEDVGAAAQASIPNQPVALNAWVRIAPDNRITIISSQAEMGQGIQTTLPAVLADELGADWQHVTLENAVADPVYRNPRVNWQFTGNSESTTAFFDLMRDMGAKAREMLIATAARRWNVKPSECHTALSYVVHQPSRRRIAFGRIACREGSPACREPIESRRHGNLRDRCGPAGHGVRGRSNESGFRGRACKVRQVINCCVPPCDRRRTHSRWRRGCREQLLGGEARPRFPSDRF
jgi:hypothetical protein